MAGLLWRGPSHALLAALADVIGRAKFDAILTRTNTSPERSLAELRRLADVIEPPPLPQPVCRVHVSSCPWAGKLLDCNS